ncbi:hypothetical protein PcaKH16_27810 [Parageobacillus caldoxylosilyticus]|nr:hypothetical protein PcaKH16_27810 [Parageobacillus caldoxylosilyticus]
MKGWIVGLKSNECGEIANNGGNETHWGCAATPGAQAFPSLYRWFRESKATKAIVFPLKTLCNTQAEVSRRSH